METKAFENVFFTDISPDMVPLHLWPGSHCKQNSVYIDINHNYNHNFSFSGALSPTAVPVCFLWSSSRPATSFIKTLSLSKNVNTAAHQFINRNPVCVCVFFSASMFTSGHAAFHTFVIVCMQGGSDCDGFTLECHIGPKTKCEM